ncbi:MAG: efflux RND transporter periplasmic adaptor subunit [Candidatus Cloacimonetes bacterium]|nr:efflux RND transporter periplasmic adaptor subunit [Candidatus Cloacimonadota bacterium]
MKKSLVIIAVLFLIILVSCNKAPQTPAQKGKMGGAGITSPVLIQNLEKRDLKEYITVSGTLEGVVDLAMISETSGKILEIYKKLGDKIEKGEEIAKLDNDYIRIQYEQAMATKLAAESAFESATSSFNVSEKLYKDGSISKLEYDNSKASLKNAQANLAGADASMQAKKLAYDNSRLIAPVSGYIAATDLRVGAYISTGSPVVTIVDYSSLLLKTGVSESELFLVKKHQQVNIKSPLSKSSISGKITGIGMKPKSGTSSYPIEIIATNPNGNYAPGMVVSASILARTYADKIYISRGVVLDDYGTKYVYIVNADLKAEKRIIALGTIVNDQVLVNEGLKPGDKLVVEGMEMLDDGAVVEIKG